MRLLRNLGGNGKIGSGSVLLFLSVFLGICSVFVSGLPQWVWNPDADTGPKTSIGSGNRLIFGGQIASDEKDKQQIKIDDTQARLFFPSIVNAITGGGRPGNRPVTTSRPSSSSSSSGGGGDSSNSGGGGGGGGGGSSSSSGQGEGNNEAGGNGGGGGGGDGGQCNTGACIGGSIASQAIDQGINAGTSVAENNKYDPIRQTTNFRPPLGGISGIFSNILQNLFGGSASTLPASIGGGSGGSSGGGGNSGGAQCTCEDRSRGCFLPQREVGSCDSGTRIRCCTSTRSSRPIFPDDDTSFTSTNSVKSVTRSQIRRALLKNIVGGSRTVIDDTLDLLLHPFLTKEDQVKVATRLLSDN